MNDHDDDIARRAIEMGVAPLWVPKSSRELRAPGTKRGTQSGYFDDLDALIDAAVAIDKSGAKATYITLNPVKPGQLTSRSLNHVTPYATATTEKADILGRLRLIVDCDPRRPRDTSASDAQHEAALAKALEIQAYLCGKLGWPEPLYIDSGNGSYLVFAIDLPNDTASEALVKRVLERLAKRFDDDVVIVDTGMFDANRIMRVPGTMNRKGDDLPDWPHRRSSVLEAPDDFGNVVVSEEQLLAFAPEEKKPTPPPAGDRTRAHAVDFDLDDFIARKLHVKSGPTIVANGAEKWIIDCEFEPEHNGKTETALFRLSSGAIVLDCKGARCAARKWEDLREKFEPGYQARRDQYVIDPFQNGKAIDSTPSRDPWDSFDWSDAADERFIGSEWLEYGRLPAEGVAITEGRGGLGKTTTNMAIIAKATIGRSFFDDSVRRAPIKVIIIAEEDARGRLRKQIELAGGNLRNVRFLKTRRLPKSGPDMEFVKGTIVLPRDLEFLAACVESWGAGIVYFDKIFGHVDLEGDGKMSHQAGKILTPLIALCQELHFLALLNRHWTKGVGPDRGQGTKDWTDAARSVLTFAEHPEGPSPGGWDRGVIALEKTNGIRKIDVPTLGYHLEGVAVVDDEGRTQDRDGRPFTVTRAVIEGPVEVTSVELQMTVPGDPDTENAGAQWMLGYLGDFVWHNTSDIEKAGAAAKHGSPATMLRISRKIGVDRQRTKTFPAVGQWRLPSPAEKAERARGVAAPAPTTTGRYRI